MADFFQILKANIDNNPPQYGDGTSVLTMLYEAYSQTNQMDDAQLKQDFETGRVRIRGQWSLPVVGRLCPSFGSPESQESGALSKEKKKDETFFWAT